MEHITPAQAVNVLWGVTGNLSRLFGWLVFWLAHLLLALVGMTLLWWFQITPEDVSRAVLGMSRSTTASVFGLAGASVLGALSLYLVMAQWVWRKTYMAWQTDQLFAGVSKGS